MPGNPYFDAETVKTYFNFSDQNASNATIAFIYIYVATFGLTWACVAWVYPPELFPTSTRGRGTSMSSATNWFVVCSPVKLAEGLLSNDSRTSGSPSTFLRR